MTIFLAWTSLKKILTMKNLQKCRVIILDYCCICKKSGKTVDHLLLHSEVARVLWVALFNRLELAWVMLTSVLALLASWTNL